MSYSITRQQTNLYYEMFDGGRALFPLNPFDDHIQFLRDNNTIPKPTIEYGMEIGLIPCHSLGVDAAVSELESVGYNVIEAMHTIDHSAFTAALDDWNARAPAFLAKMRIRGCSDHFQV